MTELQYFTDSYRFESTAKVLGVGTVSPAPSTPQSASHVVILDQTIFYPQGGTNFSLHFLLVLIFPSFSGGQPSDVGIIQSSNPSITFNVTKVIMNSITEQHVEHYGFFNPGSTPFPADTPVMLTIDRATRILHARLHSAGHLLDVAVKNSQLGNLSPGKGCHFPTGAYVEYEGVIAKEELKSTAKDVIQRCLDELIAASSNVLVRRPVRRKEANSSPFRFK